MNHTGVASIMVGENRYAVEKLPPLEAIAWGNRVFAVIAPALGGLLGEGENKAEAFRLAFSSYDSVAVTQLMTDAIKRCYSPQNEPLSNEAVFNAWFKRHPGDLFELGLLAVWELVRDFLPSRLGTVASRFQGLMPTLKDPASPSPAAGKPEPWPAA